MDWTVRGSNPDGGEIFRTRPDQPWGPPSFLYNGYRVFPGGIEQPVCDADPSPPSSAVVKKGWSYTSTPPMGPTASTDPQCLYKGALFFLLLRTFWMTGSLVHKNKICPNPKWGGKKMYCTIQYCNQCVNPLPSLTLQNARDLNVPCQPKRSKVLLLSSS